MSFLLNIECAQNPLFLQVGRMNSDQEKNKRADLWDWIKRYLMYDAQKKQKRSMSETMQDILSRSLRDKRIEDNDGNVFIIRQPKNSTQSDNNTIGAASENVSSQITIVVLILAVLIVINLTITFFNLYRVWQYQKAFLYQDKVIEENFSPYNPPLTVGENNMFKSIVRDAASDIAQRRGLRINEAIESFRDEILHKVHAKLEQA